MGKPCVNNLLQFAYQQCGLDPTRYPKESLMNPISSVIFKTAKCKGVIP